MGMGQFWVPKSAVNHKWSNFKPFCLKFVLCTWFQGISTWKSENFILEPIFALLGYWPFSGTKSMWYHIYGTCSLFHFVIWQVSLWLWYLKGGRVLNSKFKPLNRPMGMGQFWVPESAVGSKIQQFSTVSLEIWTVHMISRYLQLKTGSPNLGAICAPFGVMTLFWVKFFLT